ncbi:MAG: CoA pyrophosphatase [Dehalococcoidia bacterium]
MNTSKLTIQRLETILRSHGGPDNGHEALGSSPPAAVTLLFSMANGEPCVLMIKRAANMRLHSGEWAFPGGKIDDTDVSPMAAALRETKEELGINASDIDMWCGMAPVDTSSGFEVWPYAGRVTDNVPLIPEAGEVAEVVNIPVRVFVNDESKRTITIIRNGTRREMIAYAYEDRIIWGASAWIIQNTIDIVMNAA